MTNKEKIAKLYEILDEADVYGRAIGKIDFDMQTVAPEEGLDRAGEDEAFLSKKHFEITHSDEFSSLVCGLHDDPSGLSELENKVVDKLYDEWKKEKNLSEELVYKYTLASNKAFSKWLSAKKKNDFSIFRDSFEEVIKLTREMIEVRDEKSATVYDALLDDTERGGSISQLDSFFESLKERIIPLVERIVKDGKPIREDFMSRKCPVALQSEFSRRLLKAEGLRSEALVLSESEHPFTTNFGIHDVRVTTHYYEDNFISNIFTTMHEGGHALLMQNEPEEFEKNHISDSVTNGMHECISRFYENIIGRSEEFIHFIYPQLLEITGDTFADISERELYEAVNAVHPSLIRTESDELTYCLHIIIRYEIEKAFVNGDITVDEVPALWNKKYKEYLDVDVPDDASGCLQDVHWTGGYGYFPSYALGNAYGAQILETMKKDIDVFALVREGRLDEIAQWLIKNVFSIASITTPDEWIRRITGESLDPKYYLDYMEKKFSALYCLD